MMANCSDVVVGVDDSPASLEALRVAASEAALRGVGVCAIHVWQYPSSWGMPLNWPAGANPGEFVRERLIEEVQRVQSARRAADEPSVNVSIEVIEGDAEDELRAAAKDASMLVLGERHHQGLTPMMGSVASALVPHPPCPVLIVPEGDHP